MDLRHLIEQAWENKDLLKDSNTIYAIENVIEKLDKGELRIEEKINDKWQINEWLKKAVVL